MRHVGTPRRRHRMLAQAARTSARLLALAAVLAPASTAAQDFPEPPDGIYEFTSVQSGAWHNPATWGTVSTIPATGDDVLIAANTRVTIQRPEPARHRLIHVAGEFRLFIHGTTQLFVETLYVSDNGPDPADDGIFMIGAPGFPVAPHHTAEIVFTSSGGFDLDWDAKQRSRGLISDGTVRLFGAPKTHMIAFDQGLPAGSDAFFLEPPHGNWAAGDELVVAGTYFQRVLSPQTTSSQDERVTIDTITGDRFDLTSKLSFDHYGVNGKPFHIVNLSRNLVLRSETTTATHDRGHVMLRNGDVHIENVRFENLGRTDKRIPLDDVIVDIIRDGQGNPTDYNLMMPADAAVQNRRGRYALHFHLNGTQPNAASPPSKVYGSVVDGTIGWGFVNHSSHVDFQRNIAYDFAGAGFVTELGDELGNFFENIAIRGTGNGEYKLARVVFQNPLRPQPLSDFAFRGDGFWFQGPALRVRDNVASGCDGTGMTWFTTGAPDISDTFQNGSLTHNRYSYFPREDLDAVYGAGHGLLPRYWNHSQVDERIVISDLPILEFDNFTAYGSFVGFKLRFNNHDNVDWYRDIPFHYETHIVGVCGGNRRCAIRNRQAIDNLTLWNNEQAFRMRYTTQNDWTNVDARNRLAYVDPNPINPLPFVGHPGAEMNFQILDNTFTNLRMSGYPVNGWIQRDSADDARSEITFAQPDPPSYSWYANFDTWVSDTMDPSFIPCHPPHSIQVTGTTSQTASLVWQGGLNNTDYLLRYKPQGAQHWSFRQTTLNQAVLRLASDTTYDLQIVAGCQQTGLSAWTAPIPPFTTDP